MSTKYHKNQKYIIQFLLFLVLDILQAFGSSYLFDRGSILCVCLNLDSFVGSENLKKAGAYSTNHFGSMVVTSLKYSLVVCTTSWKTTHSGCLWKRAELG